MVGIGDFIKTAAKNLGEPEASTRSATGALLGAIKDQADPKDFQQLLSAIPGASGVLEGSSGPKSEGSGVLGGALGAVTSSVGGGLGRSLGIFGAIQKTGFSAGSIGGLVSLFMSFAKSNAGEGLVGKLVGKMPELAKLAG